MRHFFLIILLILSNLAFCNYHSNDTILNDFIRIDSLNLYRKDRNNEILTILINEDLINVCKIINWQQANNRGLISELKCDSLKTSFDSKYFYEFKQSVYKKNKILYYGNKNQTLIIFASFYNQDYILNKNIDSLFLCYDFKKEAIKANYFIYENLQGLLTDFVFKPFLWSEKIRSEYNTQLEKEKFIDGKQMQSIFDSYQIASGHNTGVGQLLAIKDFILSGQSLMIKNWKWNTDVKITSIEQLNGFIQSYDPVIDIIYGEEFKN